MCPQMTNRGEYYDSSDAILVATLQEKVMLLALFCMMCVVGACWHVSIAAVYLLLLQSAAGDLHWPCSLTAGTQR